MRPCLLAVAAVCLTLTGCGTHGATAGTGALSPPLTTSSTCAAWSAADLAEKNRFAAHAHVTAGWVEDSPPSDAATAEAYVFGFIAGEC
jgi:hypothetical protein